MWRSRSAGVIVWRSRSAGVIVWRSRSADVKEWRSRSADVRVWRSNMWRSRSADVKEWRSRSADVRVWRSNITAAFLRRTLRRRSREKGQPLQQYHQETPGGLVPNPSCFWAHTEVFNIDGKGLLQARGGWVVEWLSITTKNRNSPGCCLPATYHDLVDFPCWQPISYQSYIGVSGGVGPQMATLIG